ncbi:MAG: phosphotransferase [Mycobacteriales bacterium]|nr:aminoglycoside phosphotransferase family protein [Frankia sp.]
MSEVPAAAGVRLTWDDLPSTLRDAVADCLGAPVVATTSRPAGFSPGVALRIETARGDVAFLKAVGDYPNPTAPEMHRQEIVVTRGLAGQPFVPALRWTYDRDGWVALLFDYVDAEPPTMPWEVDDLDRVLATVVEMHAALTPPPVGVPTMAESFRDDFAGWRTLARGDQTSALDEWTRANVELLAEAESRWAAAAAGETLLHADLRADNLLLAPHQVYVVDWPWACVGAAWVDVVGMAPSVTMYGGPQPDDVLHRYVAAGGTRPADDALVAMVAAIGGYFVERSVRPAEPGLPTVRAFQTAQGAVCRDWLRRLLG